MAFNLLKKNAFGKILVIVIATVFLSFHLNAKNKMNNNQALTAKQQSIVRIAALTAKGELQALNPALNQGLDAGLTVNEIKEVLVHLYAYCGFPRSLNAINTFMAVLEERKAKGMTDVLGKEAMPSVDHADKYEQGRKTLEVLTKTPQSQPAKGYGEFAPRIDTFLKEHLFADLFENDILNYQQRELATITALASMPGLEAQLTSHIMVGKNTGITEPELIELADLVESHVSRTQANVLRKLLSQPTIPVIEPDMMVRIAEIEIFPEFQEEYKAVLKEEAAASVNVERGVIAIFPMVQKENPTQIRLVEVYASRAAYEAHLKAPHFLHYKTATRNMIKSLKLIDMKSLDTETMSLIFKKVN
jgi:alkylhydroperoxidase/carboxymuconolactone decarboxylase family protein YurZ/quinol monooxygenase YgiN